MVAGSANIELNFVRLSSYNVQFTSASSLPSFIYVVIMYCRFSETVRPSDFDTASLSLIGSLVRLYFSLDGQHMTAQCHSGRIVQRRCTVLPSDDENPTFRWEHLIHFKW